MKKLELKPVVGDSPPTAELIKVAMANKPAQGFDLKEMRERYRILDALEKAEGELLLEDADADKLKKCVEVMRWTVLDRNLMEFMEAVQDMKNVEK